MSKDQSISPRQETDDHHLMAAKIGLTSLIVVLLMNLMAFVEEGEDDGPIAWTADVSTAAIFAGFNVKCFSGG